tara:strand:+ start:900 stop:1142 length:243 start_codon:yes stop_codon:yes gene_type:complete
MEKTFFKSKKCWVFLLMLASTVGLLCTGFVFGVDSKVLEEIISTLGATTGLAAVTLIGGQSFVDGKVRPVALAGSCKNCE